MTMFFKYQILNVKNYKLIKMKLKKKLMKHKLLNLYLIIKELKSSINNFFIFLINFQKSFNKFEYDLNLNSTQNDSSKITQNKKKSKQSANLRSIGFVQNWITDPDDKPDYIFKTELDGLKKVKIIIF